MFPVDTSACKTYKISHFQKPKGNHAKFNVLFSKILLERGQSNRSDIIFDINFSKCIKNAEREKTECKRS